MLNETGACHSFTPLPVRNYSTMGEMVMPFSPRRREQSDGENCWCDSGGKSGNSLDHQWTIREGHPDPHRMRKSDLSKSATGRSAGPLRVTRTKCHRTLIRTPVPDVVLPCNARRLFDRLRVPVVNAAYSRDHRCFRPVRLERHWHTDGDRRHVLEVIWHGEQKDVHTDCSRAQGETGCRNRGSMRRSYAHSGHSCNGKPKLVRRQM